MIRVSWRVKSKGKEIKKLNLTSLRTAWTIQIVNKNKVLPENF